MYLDLVVYVSIFSISFFSYHDTGVSSFLFSGGLCNRIWGASIQLLTFWREPSRVVMTMTARDDGCLFVMILSCTRRDVTIS